MKKVVVEGFIKISSNMDMNVYSLTNKQGQYLGDITIVDQALLPRIEDVFKDQLISMGEIKSKHQPISISAGAKIAIKIEFKAEV